MRFPTLLWIAHRWLGWSVGILFALIGLAGSVLVFKEDVDAWLNPACYAFAAPGSPVAPARIEDVVRTALAGAPITDIDTVFLPEALGVGPFVLRAERDGDPMEVFVRHDGGAVLCARVWEDSLIGVVTLFHTALLLPVDATHELMAGLAAADLLLVLAGLLLWFAQRRTRRLGSRPPAQDSRTAAVAAAAAAGPARAFEATRGTPGTARSQRTGSSARRWSRIHSWIGLVAILLLPAPIVTGAAMAIGPEVRELLGLFLPFAEQRPVKPARPTAPPIGPDAAVAAALGAMPDAKPRAVVLPAFEGAPYRVFLRPPGDNRTRSGGSASVLVGPLRPEVAAVINPLSAELGDKVFAARFPLHTGEIGYLPGRMLAALSGLAPAALLATAIAAWQIRRRRRRAVISPVMLGPRTRPKADPRTGSGQASTSSVHVALVQDVDATPSRGMTTRGYMGD